MKHRKFETIQVFKKSHVYIDIEPNYFHSNNPRSYYWMKIVKFDNFKYS